MALPKTESFTNSNGTPLSTHDSGYVLVSGAQAIQSNELAPAGGTGTTENCHAWTGDSFAATQYAKATYSNGSGQFIGVAVNIQSPSANYYAWYGRVLSYGNRREMVEVSGGTVATTHYSAATNFTTGQEIYLEKASGDVLTWKFNGSTISSVTDSTWQNGSAGFASRGSGNFSRIDSGELGSLTAPPTPPIGARISLVRANDAIVSGFGRLL